MGTHPIFESDFDCLTVQRWMVNRDLVEWIRPWFCGLGSGVVDITITFPINKIMFRQQLNGITSRQAIRELKCEMKGLRPVSALKHTYRGILPPTFNRCMGRMFTFGGYDSFKRIWGAHIRDKTHLSFVAALSSGCFEALICCPFERVQTLLQDSSNNNRFKNTSEIFRVLPVREYYRGIRPILARNGPSTFLYFYVYEHSASIIRTENRIASDFCRGAMGGICATLYGYLFNVIKSRQQAILDPVESDRLRSPLRTLSVIHAERQGSIVQLYRGLPFALVRTSLSWGLTTLCYQQCVNYLKATTTT